MRFYNDFEFFSDFQTSPIEKNAELN